MSIVICPKTAQVNPAIWSVNQWTTETTHR